MDIHRCYIKMLWISEVRTLEGLHHAIGGTECVGPVLL